MRIIEIEQLVGIWRAESDDMRLDFSISSAGIGILTKLTNETFDKIEEWRGKVHLERISEECYITIEGHLKMHIVIFPQEEKIVILEIGNQGRFEFKKLITLL